MQKKLELVRLNGSGKPSFILTENMRQITPLFLKYNAPLKSYSKNMILWVPCFVVPAIALAANFV